VRINENEPREAFPPHRTQLLIASGDCTLAADWRSKLTDSPAGCCGVESGARRRMQRPVGYRANANAAAGGAVLRKCRRRVVAHRSVWVQDKDRVLAMLAQHFRSGLRRALTSLVACLGDITLKAINPPGLWGMIPFRFGPPYWPAIGQSTCRSVFGATCPINETSFVINDPISLAVCAKWSVIHRHARFMRCPRESRREQ